MWKKLQRWKERLLSKPGKEVLIKAVAQAIPTYLMSMFAVPDGVIDELHSLMARFWWGSTDTKRSIHWWNWEKMCQPKRVEGMGFRDLRVFNQALLAKQIWRIMVNPQSLVARVLKARYFKNTTILEARRGYDPSYTWRSLWGSKALLLEGLRWRVGCGDSIKVWDDPWLPGEAANSNPRLNINADPELRVAELIDVDNGVWDLEKLRQNLTEEEALKVCAIPLSARMPADQLYWWPARHGQYTVRTACRLGLTVEAPVRVDVNQADDGEIWRLIWGLRVPPKLIHFLWRVMSNTIAVKENLGRRHCCVDMVCGRCGMAIESASHLFFECSWVRQIWMEYGLAEIIDSEINNICALKMIKILQQLSDIDKTRFLAIAWALWMIRNELEFEEESQQPVLLTLKGFIRLVEDYKGYLNATSVDRGGQVCRSSDQWSPPQQGIIKINTDAALFGNGEVGLGMVGRDKDGVMVLASSMRVMAGWAPEIAEMKAVLFGLEVCKECGVDSVMIESDSLLVVKAVQGKVFDRTPFGLGIEDVCYLADSFNFHGCFHVKRGGNMVAHYIARLCSVVGEKKTFVDVFPEAILTLSELDLI